MAGTSFQMALIKERISKQRGTHVIDVAAEKAILSRICVKTTRVPL